MDQTGDAIAAAEAAPSGAAERQRLITRLLARLAHEIRNPLSSLDIHVQLLEEDLAGLAPAARDRLSGRLKIIRGELQRLDTIVQQYVNLAGPSPANRQTVDAGGVVQQVCELLQPEAAARGIAIETGVEPPVPSLSADAVQLTQALVNLVINAIQAVERDGRVAVSARFGEGGTAVLFEVSDSGPGVPAAKRAAVFEPFFTTKTEGSGLGLWIVQQIAAAHGGTVAVADSPLGGARFSLRLPVGEPAAGA